MKHGFFSTSLGALELQLKGLFDSIGGEAAIKLLDSLALLGTNEQAAVLSSFSKVIDIILAGDRRCISPDDKIQAQAANLMCDEITREFEKTSSPRQKLEVLPGGRAPKKSSAPIDLSKVRRQKKSEFIPELN